MNEKLKEKVKESLSSVLPITLIVLVLSVTLVPMEIGTLALFLTGAVLLIVGMGFFQLGAEMSMTPLGEGVGKTLAKREKVLLVVLVAFALGTIITIAEPDLQVLANQVASIPNNVLIWTVAVGVGVFLALAVLRILFRVSLAKCLLAAYALLFVLTLFSPKEFLAVAFDAGGVTTGPITVPFIMALGVGVSAIRSTQGHDDDSFGLVALCSVGPILMVLLLGIFYHPTDAAYSAVEIAPVVTTRDVARQFALGFPGYAEEVLLSILPIVAVFVLFQLLTRCYRRRQLLRTGVGFLYTVIGLILFLTGVNVGFTPVGNLLGSGLAGSAYRWVLIPIGALIGYYIVKAEPAVQVLNKQVEDVTGGTVSQSMMNTALSIGVACAVMLSMVLIITNHEYRRKLEQTFQNFRIPIYYQCQGHGTAPSEMLDIFGLSGSGRLLTIGLLPKFLVRDLLDALQQRIPLHKRGGGIVLTIPITGLQRPILQLLNDQMRETIEQKIEERVDSDMSDMQTSAGYTAIWVALSNGYSSDAIDAARSAGAMGGTILKGRRQNSKRISQKLGISMQEEEEFVVIVTPREKKAAVMNAISDACGLRTDAHGIILSLPVDEVIGLETGENTL